MTVTQAPPAPSFFSLFFQYTVEAYKAYQKLAETIPNPILAKTFKSLAEEERDIRDLLEIHYGDSGERMKITLGADLRFQEILNEDLSHSEQLDWLASREKTIERRLRDVAGTERAPLPILYRYIAAIKREHATILQREREVLNHYPDWFRREDAHYLLVKGER